MKVLHVLDHSLPYFSGYSFRSDYILRAQRQLGLHPVVVTSPKHENFRHECETVDGVDYHRLRWPRFSARIPLVNQAVCLAVLTKEIRRLAGVLKVDVIHAHSPSINGLAAVRAAHESNLPVIYELRYYDEDAAVDRGKTSYNSLRYRLTRRLEQSALEKATRVTTISKALRADLISRGIDAGKVFEIPNGVDTSYFHPREPDAGLTSRHGLAGKTVIGFVGSFYFYEGLEHLIDAMILLLAKRSDVKLLLVGEGEADRMLRERVPGQLWDHFVLAGKAPHADVRRVYSAMDILVYPRVRSRLTELTTPLKPLEAMAMEKVVVGSDVGGLRELFNDGEAGFLVEPENPHALAKRLLSLIESANVRRAMGKRAREFVMRERDWEKIVPCYLNVYQEGSREK
ncbi:MAG: TIGR04063 family PEP-CTERM/XrtA system glycosyltransferase [Blastocatellales bacterium]